MEPRPYSMACPHCAKTLRYGTGVIGKSARCPGCGQTVTVPSPEVIQPVRPQPPTAKPPALPQAVALPPEPPALPQPVFPEPEFTAPESPPPVPVEWNDFRSSPTVPSKQRALPVIRKVSSAPKVAGLGIGGVVLFVLLAVGGVYGINHIVNGPLQKTIADDARNKGVEAKAYYGNMGLSILVFDLTKISASNSRLDVFRVFLQFAKALKDKRFDSVQLAWRGKVKFVVSGEYFQKLGQEFDSQNPMYTIRTFPENLRTVGGERAFSEWEGGVLGVLKAQMDDFNHFHDQWYLDDLSRGS